MSEQKTELLNEILDVLPEIWKMHAPTSRLHHLLSRLSQAEAEKIFQGAETQAHLEGPLKDLKFPFHQMGNISSLHLFGLDELIIFSFYWANRARYRKVIDLGANIGLHSIAMSKCGYEVRAYEPDPENYKVLQRNLDLNRAGTVKAINAAVSTRAGKMDFVRVLGNLTGNHLAGAKTNAYGDLQTVSVTVEEFKPLLQWADLAKIDVEGHERELILSTQSADWDHCEALLEVGTGENAEAIFRHLKGQNVNMFAQKINWEPVRDLSQMPTSYRDGTLFLSKKIEMPWMG